MSAGAEKSDLSSCMKYMMCGLVSLCSIGFLRPFKNFKTGFILTSAKVVKEYKNYTDMEKPLNKNFNTTLCKKSCDGVNYCRKYTYLYTFGQSHISTPVGIGSCDKQAPAIYVHTASEVKLDAQKQRKECKLVDKLRRIIAVDGLCGLCPNNLPSLTRTIAIQLTDCSLYIQIKKKLREGPLKIEEGQTLYILGGLTSGVLTSICFMPLRTVKKRLYTSEYKGVFDTFINLGKREGLNTYWTGFTPYCCRITTKTIIIVLFLEEASKVYKKFKIISIENNCLKEID